MERVEFVNELDFFIEKILKKGLSVEGCGKDQMMSLESQYGRLPEFYNIFLEKMGVSAGDFKEGTWFFFSELQDINEETVNLMKENNVTPPYNMFAFLMHQGYTSLFFTDVIDSDPVVYCYAEGEDITDINMTFSQFMKAEISEYLN
ncbi:SMI1/KNR4 family protein [Kosakonia cowanii]|uniref:SMI1/KNR4 family protein n=1 Tax=Kosakonia TaxID=1330547 RepID=UPI002DDCCFFC|nr:SMI1/KNR4 family protein [Kosakonia cowanii]MBS5775879.1 SMI1/KNR4 family protein [Enterobacter cloacae]WRY61541.1 SMI1/KNR4 family protein [Kosakonia cowanii]